MREKSKSDQQSLENAELTAPESKWVTPELIRLDDPSITGKFGSFVNETGANYYGPS